MTSSLDSSSERESRRHSLEEDKKARGIERKRSVQEINRRSPQDTSVRKEITEEDVSCIESGTCLLSLLFCLLYTDAGETVTLDKLQADQIFIGMISMRELPKLHTNNFVDVLREAGMKKNSES